MLALLTINVAKTKMCVFEKRKQMHNFEGL